MKRRSAVSEPALTVLLVLTLGATSAKAGTVRTHRVAAGESASSIAKSYYGDHELSELLLGYNGRSGTVVRVGESLKIPVCDEHVIRAGDTGSVLAQRYLGQADRWPVVAELNGLSPARPLRVGQRIVLPVVLDHTLRPGETLAVLARRFYGESEDSTILQRYNAIDDPRRLSVGETVKIPLVAFRASGEPRSTARPPARPAPETAPAPAPVVVSPPEPPEPRFTSELRSASLALAGGDFDRASEQVVALRADIVRDGTRDEQAEMWRLWAFLSVARDDEVQVCRAYRELIALQTDPAPDPDLVSPKIRDAFARCDRSR